MGPAFYSGPLQAEDFERGAAATSLLGVRFETLLEVPLERLRQRLGLPARAPARLGRIGVNSCGGVTVLPFFTPILAA